MIPNYFNLFPIHVFVCFLSNYQNINYGNFINFTWYYKQNIESSNQFFYFLERFSLFFHQLSPIDNVKENLFHKVYLLCLICQLRSEYYSLLL